MTKLKEKCHYCGAETTDKKNYYEHTMYGVIKGSFVPGAVYTYSEKKVIIPRCEDCEKRHNDLFFVIEVPLFLAGFIYMLWDFTYNVSDSGFRILSLIPSFIAGIASAGIIGYIIRALLTIFKKNNKGKSENNIKSYPAVKELLDLGWKINKPPKGEYITNEDLIDESPYKKTK